MSERQLKTKHWKTILDSGTRAELLIVVAIEEGESA
jgi:hypothetical protein